MLPHMTNTMDHPPQTDETNKCSKPGTFHEMHCKTRTNQEGLMRIILKICSSSLTAYGVCSKTWEVLLHIDVIFNKRGLKRKIPKFA